MKLTAQDLLKLGVIDEIIEEPVGGAHRNHEEVAQNVKNIILKEFKIFRNMSSEEIYEHRKNKFLKIGRGGGFNKTSSRWTSRLRVQ